MKRRFLSVLLTLAVLVGLAIPMAAPALADPFSLLTEKLEFIHPEDVGTHPVGVYLIGMEVHYTLRLLNTHSTDTADFAANAITDIEPGGSPTVPLNPAPVSLAPGDEWIQDYHYTIIAGDIVPGPGGINVVINTLSATGTQGIENFTSTGTQTVQVVQPAISVTKEADVDVSKVGDTINYTITIENTGDWPLVDITVVDDVLGNLSGSFVDILAPLASDTKIILYVVPDPEPADPLVNVVTATGVAQDFDATIEGATVEDTATDSVDLVHPEIDITKSVDPTTSKAGDEVIYTITVTNTSVDVSLENIVVTDPLLGVGPLPGFPATLAAGASSGPVNFPYQIQPGDPNPLLNTATVHADPLGPLTNDITDSDDARVDLVHPSIDITKTVNPTTSKAGDTVTYTITVTNTSVDVSLENIVVTDPLLGVGPLPGFPATLAAGASSGPVNFPYQIQPGDPNPLLNTATVHADPLGPLTNDITDSVGPVRVDLVHPSIDITKTANPTSGNVGTMITYTIVVTNTSTDIGLENIVVTDPLLGVGPLPGFPATLAPLASSGPVNFQRAIQAGDPDPLVNTATVHADPLGPLTNDITDSDDASVDIAGGEGLTPGFWKNNADKWDASQWAPPYDPEDLVKDVFTRAGSDPYTELGDATLLEGLSFKGGNTVEEAAETLLRQAIAAVLNAAHPDVDYPLSIADITTQVNNALDSEDRDTILSLAETLDGYNNLGADISQHGPY